MKLLFPLWVMLFPQVCAQDKIVILSSKVGEVIDKTEREYFPLFRQHKNFSKVLFYKSSYNEYSGVFFLTQSDSSEKDTVINYSESILCMLAEKIENWEELKNGNYKIGQHPVVLSFKEVGLIPKRNYLPAQKEITSVI